MTEAPDKPAAEPQTGTRGTDIRPVEHANIHTSLIRVDWLVLLALRWQKFPVRGASERLQRDKELRRRNAAETIAKVP